MSKFHINKHGVPAPCRAKKGNCPLGGDETHFSSEKEAQKYIDEKNERDYDLMPKVSSNKNKKKVPSDRERLTNKLQDYWQDEKMVKHELKNNKYIELNGSFVEIPNAKPKIEPEIWYDDEQETPEVNFENFYNNNAINMPKHLTMKGRNLEGTGSLKIASKYVGQDTLELAGLTYQDNPKGEYREVTQDELDEINKAIDEARANYDKRLKSYYKRYPHKIVAKGYWKNR